jgi:hypothetical protein
MHARQKIACITATLFCLLGVVNKLSTENGIPEPACDSETKLVIEEVMSKVILLELLVPKRQVLVVKEVMRKIVADISEDTSTVGCYCSIPVVEKNGMSQLPERSSQSSEESGRHNKTVPVHGKIMVDTVKDKMKTDSYSIIGQVAGRISIQGSVEVTRETY